MPQAPVQTPLGQMRPELMAMQMLSMQMQPARMQVQTPPMRMLR